MRALLLTIVFGSVALVAQTVGPQVTPQDLADGLKDPGKWLLNGGDYNGHRHSPLTQITPANVGQLTAQWSFQTGALGNFQTTPIVIDGVIYATGFGGNAWAIDARSGRTIWRHRRALPEDMHLCCGTPNRGFAALGDRLFLATADAHLLALALRHGARLATLDRAITALAGQAADAVLQVPVPRSA